MKKLLLMLAFTLSICILGNSNKVIKSSKFLLEERIPELSEITPEFNMKYMDYLAEGSIKVMHEVYKNNIWDNQKVENYNEKNDKIKVTYYYSKNKLGKIVKEIIGEEKQELEIYYLKGKEPLYVISKSILYDVIQDNNIENLDNSYYGPVHTKEYYFVNNRLFNVYDNVLSAVRWEEKEDELKKFEKNIRKNLNLLISEQ